MLWMARTVWPPSPKERDDGKRISLRWIVCHLIEEYARHNGHADLLRESIDGATGELVLHRGHAPVTPDDLASQRSHSHLSSLEKTHSIGTAGIPYPRLCPDGRSARYLRHVHAVVGDPWPAVWPLNARRMRQTGKRVWASRWPAGAGGTGDSVRPTQQP